jgi:hypothetical protein
MVKRIQQVAASGLPYPAILGGGICTAAGGCPAAGGGMSTIAFQKR